MAKEIYCPYCKKVVRAGKIRWFWFFVHLLIGYLPIYLFYCLCTKGRICPECKNRVWEKKDD